MALTIARVTGADRIEGNKKVKVRDVTFDNSYPTTGEPLAAADVGLKVIEFVRGLSAKNATGTLGLPLAYDYTNSKLQALEYNGAAAGVAQLQEVANTTNLAAFTARLEFVGY